MKKNLLKMMVTLVIIFSFYGCAEHRYYHRNHRHTDEYYHRHNQTPPPGVDINIHN